MSFLENVQFPTNVSYGSRGGPIWKTDIITLKSGHERRNAEWVETKYFYDAAYGVKSYANLQSVINVFHQAQGRANGFRYKDWLDYQGTTEKIDILDDGTGQLVKTYGTYERRIQKPINPITINNASGSVAADTGIVTFSGLSTDTYSSIDQTNPANVNHVGHTLSTGDIVRITGEGGMTEVNNRVFTVTVTGVDDYTLDDEDATGYSAGTGGTITIYPQNISWTGEFDVPVRFQNDELNINLDAYNIGSATIPLVGIRIT